VGGGGGEGQLVPLPAQLPAHLLPLVGGLFYLLLIEDNTNITKQKLHFPWTLSEEITVLIEARPILCINTGHIELY
jgi:hypothetical protein